MVEQQGDGVREDLAQQPACQMPHVTCPYPLYGVATHELAKNSIYAVAKPAEEGTPLGVRVSLLSGVWCKQPYAPARQLLLGLGRVVVAVPDDQAGGALGEFGEDRKFVGVGWSNRQTGNDVRPTDPCMHSEAIEGLLEEDVLAESSLPIETPAAIGSGEQAHRQGQRIRQGEGGIVRGLSQRFLPEELFSLPQVRCLPAEGGAMHTSEVREEVGVVASEVPKELFVFIYAKKTRRRALW